MCLSFCYAPAAATVPTRMRTRMKSVVLAAMVYSSWLYPITESIPAGDSAVGNYVEEGRELALRCLPGAYKKDSPIKLGTAGQFTLATSDTDSVIGYSQDEYTIAASTTDFIRVRMRVGTVAAAGA